ncbi:C-Jun-amino-terminal kinase-interacting protein 1-like [Actinia tenebrosa]|uniref:C-Jun-amino-terminal kinase-interacting protein 1-like n=1 Tax=Actinia tenebrosa TaxID=6105 RepID=A0A6P8I5B3_ACTTE|nr:C-Jun-amino-terminal kinase-interacting protein 1-like [Actinia tenebrosa]
MTSEYENKGTYPYEINEITRGINALATNLNEQRNFHSTMENQRSPSSNSYVNSSKRIQRREYNSQMDDSGAYNGNYRQYYLPPSPRNNMASFQTGYPISSQPTLPQGVNPPYQMRKTQIGTVDARLTSPLDDPSQNRISDLSISSSGSYSSHSSTDEISNLMRQTHIAVYKFNVRHEDEISLEVGDAICLLKSHDESWFEGTNLRSGQTGMFPSRYVSDILQYAKKRDSSSSLVSSNSSDNNQFYLRFLGSVEVADFKGNEVLCSAMKEIVKQHQMASESSPPYCTLDISIRGIKITEHQGQLSKPLSGKKPSRNKITKLFDKDQSDLPESCHFFNLKNVTFCGCHPNNSRYFAFITKHPEESRFACHVFMSEFSTEPVAYAIGKAFKEFYNEFLDYQSPT